MNIGCKKEKKDQEIKRKKDTVKGKMKEMISVRKTIKDIYGERERWMAKAVN